MVSKWPYTLGENFSSLLNKKSIYLKKKKQTKKNTIVPIPIYIPTQSLNFQFKLPKAKELMLLSCGVGEDSWESLGLQADQISQS